MGRSEAMLNSWRIWSVAEVGEWIGTLSKVAKFAPAFVECDVNGEVLASLDEKDLEGEI